MAEVVGTAVARAIRRERKTMLSGLVGANPGNRRQFGRLLMPVAPTVTYGTTFASSQIASSALFPLTDSAFRLLCGLRTDIGSVTSSTTTYYRSTISGVNNVPNANATLASVAFTTDADKIEVSWYGPATWNMRVDGQWAFSAMQSSGKTNGERYLTMIDFGSAGLREVVLVGIYAMNGVRVGPKFRVYPPLSIPAPVETPVIAALTDSYGQQITTLHPGAFVYNLCLLMGWDDLRLSPVGGTGFLNNNSLGPYSTARDRAQADILSANPDLILVCLGINDQGRQTKAVLQAETTLTFAMLRAGAPNARIIATGPWAPSATLAASSAYTDVRDAIFGGLQTIRGPWLFVDNLTGLVTRHDGATVQQQGPWITGDGRTGAPNNSGNADRFIGPNGTDVTHPSADGSDYLGFRLAAAITAQFPL